MFCACIVTLRASGRIFRLMCLAAFLTGSAVFSPQAGWAKEIKAAYTGILIDARHLPTIDRSPAPCLFGPQPASVLLYPDRSNVPTPDEVQEQSVVRYYKSEDEARKGFVGANPLILKAVEVVGPAHDSLRLSAEDMAILQAADKTIQFTKNWKVGFLIPGDAAAPAPTVRAAPPASPAPLPVFDIEDCTGILIDCRHLLAIDRSPAPCIFGPEPESVLAYPDRNFVPTPDEVQEQSVIRYYHTSDEAQKGHVGPKPLILRAIAVVGPAHDSVRLSAADLEMLQKADKKIQFTRNWKVGFLLPADR